VNKWHLCRNGFSSWVQRHTNKTICFHTVWSQCLCGRLTKVRSHSILLLVPPSAHKDHWSNKIEKSEMAIFIIQHIVFAIVNIVIINGLLFLLDSYKMNVGNTFSESLLQVMLLWFSVSVTVSWSPYDQNWHILIFLICTQPLMELQ